MSDRATLLALAARCEAATGADREWDWRIYLAIKGRPWTATEDAWMRDNGAQAFPASLPRYTASIDAALTLVPDGWKWTLHSADTAGPPCAYCVPNMGRLPWPMWVNDVSAATPALALCAATLRARAMEVGNGE